MRRLIALIFCIAVASLGPFSFANADTVAVIGTGLMGGAVGPRFAELGHDVVYGCPCHLFHPSINPSWLASESIN